MISVIVLFTLVLAFIVSEKYQNYYLSCLFKTLASLCFVITAYMTGCLHHLYGQLVLAALILGAIGDILLLSKSKMPLLFGVFVFAIGHAVYFFAFLSKEINWLYVAASIPVLFAAATIIKRCLLDTIEEWFQPIGMMYLLCISSMVAMAVGNIENTNGLIILVACILFYISDYFVAKGVFKGRTFTEFTIAISIYYIAQIIFALTSN